jgi:GntR family transcriptional regulator, uxu operon transcriptional repressor
MGSRRTGHPMLADVSNAAPPPEAGRSRATPEETSKDALPRVEPSSDVAIGGRRQTGVMRRDDVRSNNAQAASSVASDVADVVLRSDADGAHYNHKSYDRLSDEITQLILRDKLRPNDRLPSERILSERMNVSRTSLREAIIALEIRGVVEVKSGSGIYVRALTPMSFLGESSTGPFELLRGRLIMEPEICAVAAIEAKDSDFDAIYQTIATMRSTVEDKRENELADRGFHVAIATATGNEMLGQIVGAVWDRRKGDMWEKIEEHFHTSALRQSAIDDHQRIFNALHARDPIMAKTQMKMHIERVIREFGKAW